jgi:WD40 repeat protein
MRGTVLASVSQQTRRRFSRRAVVLGLVGLAATGSGLTWLAFSQRQLISSAIPTPIPLGTTFLTYRGESPYKVDTIAWSPDGKYIASSDESDGITTQVWDANSGNPTFTYTGFSEFDPQGKFAGGVNSVAWSPNGKRIASGSADTTVQVWQAS